MEIRICGKSGGKVQVHQYQMLDISNLLTKETDIGVGDYKAMQNIFSETAQTLEVAKERLALSMRLSEDGKKIDKLHFSGDLQQIEAMGAYRMTPRLHIENALRFRHEGAWADLPVSAAAFLDYIENCGLRRITPVFVAIRSSADKNRLRESVIADFYAGMDRNIY